VVVSAGVEVVVIRAGVVVVVVVVGEDEDVDSGGSEDRDLIVVTGDRLYVMYHSQIHHPHSNHRCHKCSPLVLVWPQSWSRASTSL
jgi:hypothetical protein